METKTSEEGESRNSNHAALRVRSWVLNVNNREAPVGVYALTKTIKSVFLHISEDESNGLAGIDVSLTMIDPQRANPMHAAVVLSTLCSHRSRLFNWDSVASMLRSEFESRMDPHLDVNDLLMGLPIPHG